MPKFNPLFFFLFYLSPITCPAPPVIQCPAPLPCDRQVIIQPTAGPYIPPPTAPPYIVTYPPCQVGNCPTQGPRCPYPGPTCPYTPNNGCGAWPCNVNTGGNVYQADQPASSEEEVDKSDEKDEKPEKQLDDIKKD